MGDWTDSLFDHPDPDREQPGKVGRDHPSTSKASALRGMPGFATERARVLRYVANAPLGATAAEVADRLGRSRNQVATRLLELREQGWTVYLADPDGQPVRRSTGHGNTGLVHVLNPDARMDFARWLSTQPNPRS